MTRLSLFWNRISPNPNNGIFTIALGLDKPKDIEIIIFDITGRVVYKDQMKRQLSNKIDLDLSYLSTGLYNCTIKAGSSTSSRRIIVERM